MFWVQEALFTHLVFLQTFSKKKLKIFVTGAHTRRYFFQPKK